MRNGEKTMESIGHRPFDSFSVPIKTVSEISADNKGCMVGRIYVLPRANFQEK